jgi:hypothetical protein
MPGCTDGCWIEFGPVDSTSDLIFLLESWQQLGEDAQKRICASVRAELETGAAVGALPPRVEGQP